MATDGKSAFTVDKDGALIVTDGETTTRYTKESDLLTIKASRTELEKKLKDEAASHLAALEAASTTVEAHRQKVLQAEARITGLEEQLKLGGSKDELDKVKQELAAAKKVGEELGNKALGYRRAILVTAYGIPAATVENKSIEELDRFEEALKAVGGVKNLGNYAAGGGAGGAAAQVSARETIRGGFDKLHPADAK